ncbi:MATE family efflux transporter [Dokdonella immobilis]|uniref:Multidrug-efflux transporter n=1 Tax=Dokdonella immobilis TaxID=578942 RepID=A0A1I4VJJ2_9GAMM|nr:MATE family efflux transporter [Dokdonella immobilis]SFN01303.1 multidrug resistance protein, MATE family [Dokdonella immobilis]
MTAILSTDRPRLASELDATVRLALPLVLGQLSTIGMNLIDTVLAGHLNAHTLGAVALGSNVWVLSIIIIIGMMMSLQPSIAQLRGAGREHEIGPLFRQALWLALPLGIGLGLATAFVAPGLFGLIGVDASLVADAGAFLRAIAWGAPALSVFFVLRGLSEGMGLTRPTMYFSLLGLTLLGPIGYTLMYGAFGVPSLGARGCGLATAIVLWLQCLAFAVYLARRKRYRELRLLERYDAPHWRTIGELMHIGMPIAVTLLMEAGLFVAVALAIGKLGTDVIAGHQIAINIASVAFMVPLGIAMATTVRVGHARGRGDAHGVRQAGTVGLILTLGVQLVSATLLFTIPERIASMYTDDAAVIALAAQLLTLAAIFQLSDGIQAASNGALRGLKDTRLPMLITGFAYWGVGMPVGWWLAFPAGLGARGMWMGLIAGLTVAAVLLTVRFWGIANRNAAAV